MVVNAVDAAVYRDDIAATIKYRKGMAVLERARAPLLERDIRVDVERRRLTGAGPFGTRLGGIAALVRRVRQRSRPPEP